MVKTYDPASYDLAVHFLQDEPLINDEEHKVELARHIQQAVEDWFMPMPSDETSPMVERVLEKFRDKLSARRAAEAVENTIAHLKD